MSFLKDLLSGDPVKSAAKHEKRARTYHAEGNETKAADSWAAAGREYAKIPDYQRAYESFLQASQFYLAVRDDKREAAILFDAADVAIANQDFSSASTALEQVTRIGTRKKDDELLIRVYSLQSIFLLAGNDLAKSKQTYREAEKIAKRIGRKKIKTRTYSVAQILVNRFIDGENVSTDLALPSRVDESETVNQLVIMLLTLFQDTQSSSLTLKLDKGEVKIKEQVSGKATISFPAPTKVLDIQLTLPSNIALLEEIGVPKEPKKKLKIRFTLDPRLPGTFDVGPMALLLQINGQQFQFKSNSVPLEIAAAKPKINLIADSVTPPHSQEEFELILRVENNSHGDASDVVITVVLPPTLLLKTGTLEKRIISLPSQQHVQFPLYLIATKAGTHEGEITCNYLGPSGEGQKVVSKFFVEILPRVRKEKD
jgi:tetratricopeptide (TPR) repeat protein